MSKLSPFPYETLPKYKLEEVQLKKKLLNAYYFFENRAQILKDLVTPLQEILNEPLQIEITHLESSDLENLVSSLPEKTLLGLVRLEPQGRKAVLLFETLLAKILVYKTLSGGKIDQEKISRLQLKPLTSLEEAVVQYILISIIEKLSTHISPKNFNIAYDDVVHDSKKLMGSFSHQDQFAVFSIQLHLLEKDFYLKFVLPIAMADDLGITEMDEKFVKERLKQFERFQVPIQLEVAQVTLEPSDLDQLSAGDIIMFDDVLVEQKGSQITGQAKMTLAQEDSREGYLVELHSKGSTLQATVKSVL